MGHISDSAGKEFWLAPFKKLAIQYSRGWITLPEYGSTVTLTFIDAPDEYLLDAVDIIPTSAFKGTLIISKLFWSRWISCHVQNLFSCARISRRRLRKKRRTFDPSTFTCIDW